MGKESEYPLEVKWIDVKHKGNLEDAFQIRRNVFINEQNVPEEEEFDEADLKSHHAVRVCRWLSGSLRQALVA